MFARNYAVRTFININGKLLPADTAAVPSDARAFRYGYGLFETMLICEGRIRLEEFHWQRLREGMKALYIESHPHFFQELKDSLRKTLLRNGHERLARVRLQVWPASGGYYDGEQFNAQYCIESYPLDESLLRLNENGLVIGVAEGIIKPFDSVSHLKSCNALPYALAARQAKEHRWNDALLLNSHDKVADSTIANVFWSDGDNFFTPPLSEGCVAGVMRKYLLSFLPLSGYSVMERPAAIDDLLAARQIFLSNAIRGIRWVRSFKNHEPSIGIAGELHEKLLKSFSENR